MASGPWRVNILWKLLRNYSGVILELLEINLGSFSNQKVNIWNSFLYMSSEKGKNKNLIFKSHHLVMNPGQGPHLKCAPGQDSVKDSNIIKSY